MLEQPADSFPPVSSMSQVEELTGLSHGAVVALIKDKELKSFRVGRRILVRGVDLAEFVNTRAAAEESAA